MQYAKQALFILAVVAAAKYVNNAVTLPTMVSGLLPK